MINFIIENFAACVELFIFCAQAVSKLVNYLHNKRQNKKQ